MNLARVGELSLVETLRKRFGARKESGLIIGIGDDAAAIRTGTDPCLLSTDMMVEGVHFDLSYSTHYQAGFKLVSVNVSDIYAMGGKPGYLLLNVAAPGGMSEASFSRLFDGIEDAARLYRVVLIGGDMSASDKLILSATVIGSGTRLLRRSGARRGDRIYVSGYLGEAACGMELLKRRGRPVELEKGRTARFPVSWNVSRPLISRHLMPVAVRPGRYAPHATAMMDVSDGLLIDLARLCRESGVGARLQEESIPVSAALREASAYFGRDPLSFVLSGGEDYELLFTSPKAVPGAFCIGEVTGRGVSVVDGSGRRRKITTKGYQHFGVQG